MSIGTDSKQRTGRLVAGSAGMAVLVAVAITGCSQDGAAGTTTSAPASQTSTTPSPSASPTPAALTCDDLASKADIVKALAAGQSADDWVVQAASTADGSITGEKAVEGAGGLSCSWQAGPPDSETGDPMLTVSILPDAAKQWSAQMYGDGPTSDRRTFAGVSAAATCGDPGCGASAVVGSAWVRVDLVTGSREGGTSAFAKESDDQVFAGLKPAIESAFEAVQGASSAQLAFANHVPGAGQAVDCRWTLRKADLAGALKVKAVRLDSSFAPDPKAGSIFAAAQQRLGESVCFVEDAQYSYATELASVTIAPDQSWAVDDLATKPAERGDLREVRLQGLGSGDRALSSCATVSECTVLFTDGTTAIQVDNSRYAQQVAEAVLAAMR